MDDSNAFLQPNATVNSDHPRVLAFVRRNISKNTSSLERVVDLYRAVRDQIYYDPYRITLTVHGLIASTTLESGFGWCVPKAALLAACCRAIGVPASLGYADVRNHLTTDRLKKRMRSDIFYWHGYTNIFLDRRWVKATPAFNASLCAKCRIKPLDFDGRSDAVFYPFDEAGRRHMEYINDRGAFADIPIEEIRCTFESQYPNFMTALDDADFAADLAPNE